jgi:hypothetical protein
LVFIIGPQYDLCCVLVANELARRGQNAVHIREESLWQRFIGSLTIEGDKSTAPAVFFEERGITAGAAAFVRLSGRPPYQIAPTEDMPYMQSEWAAFMRAWLQSLPGPVVNRVPPELWFQTSLGPPLMLSRVPRLADLTAKFALTNVPGDAVSFVDNCPNGATVSPFTCGTRWIVRHENADELTHLTDKFPLQLIERPSGDAVEIVVTQNQATVIPTSVSISPAIIQRLIEAAKDLGVAFCRFEGTQALVGQFTLLRIDLMPRIERYPQGTNREIVDNLVRLLIPSTACDRRQSA